MGKSAPSVDPEDVLRVLVGGGVEEDASGVELPGGGLVELAPGFEKRNS